MTATTHYGSGPYGWHWASGEDRKTKTRCGVWVSVYKTYRDLWMVNCKRCLASAHKGVKG